MEVEVWSWGLTFVQTLSATFGQDFTVEVQARFGSWNLVIKLNFCSDFEHKVWSRFWSLSSGEILKLKFGQYFAADVWLRLRSWILVKIMKLGLVNISSLSLVEMLIFGWDFKVNAWSRFRNWSLIKICVVNLTLGSVVPLALFFMKMQSNFEQQGTKVKPIISNPCTIVFRLLWDFNNSFWKNSKLLFFWDVKI